MSQEKAEGLKLPRPSKETSHVELVYMFDESRDSSIRVKVIGNLVPGAVGTRQLFRFDVSRYQKVVSGVWTDFSPTPNQVRDISNYLKVVIDRRGTEFIVQSMVNLAGKILSDFGYSEDRRVASAERKADAKNLAMFIDNLNSSLVAGALKLPKSWIRNSDDRVLMAAPKVINSAKKFQTVLSGLRGSYYETAHQDLSNALSSVKDISFNNSMAVEVE